LGKATNFDAYVAGLKPTIISFLPIPYLNFYGVA